MRLIAIVSAIILAFALAAPARAACNLNPAVAATFTPASSYAVRAGEITPVSSSPALQCSGAILGLSTTNSARLTVTSASGFNLQGPAGDAIRYRLSIDQAATYPLGNGATVDYFDPGVYSLLGRSNASDFETPVYARLVDTPNVAAGTYTDTVTMQWTWRVCGGVGVGGVCVRHYTGSGTTTLRVTMVVGNDCRISAPPVVFGRAPLAREFAPVTQAVAVDCTKGTRFAIGFTAGGNGTARPWRAMTDGAGHKLYYNLYRADGVTIWDQTNPLTDPRPGTGGSTPGLFQTYVARIDPNQATPPAGAYHDTITVTLSF